jgi:hypothetical protein
MLQRIISVLTVLAIMAAMMVVTASAALAQSDQACENTEERHDRFLDRIEDPDPSRGALQSHLNSHKPLAHHCGF